jgi:ribosomal protein S28E/S33
VIGYLGKAVLATRIMERSLYWDQISRTITRNWNGPVTAMVITMAVGVFL